MHDLHVPFCFLCLCSPPKPENFKIFVDSRTLGFLILQSVVLISSHFDDSFLLCPFSFSFLFQYYLNVTFFCPYTGTFMSVLSSCLFATQSFFSLTFVSTLQSIQSQTCPNLSCSKSVTSQAHSILFLGKKIHHMPESHVSLIHISVITLRVLLWINCHSVLQIH